MTGELVPVRIGNVDLLVETTVVPGSEPTSGRLGEAGRQMVNAFDEAERAIVEIAGRLAGTVADLGKRGTRPDHVEVQFGLKFSAQGKVEAIPLHIQALAIRQVSGSPAAAFDLDRIVDLRATLGEEQFDAVVRDHIDEASARNLRAALMKDDKNPNDT